MSNSSQGNEFNTPINGVALSSRTEALIMLRYSPSIFFKIARLSYEVYIDGSYQYEFMPYYDVIDGLPASIFHGIPGINLDLRLKRYYRVNMHPVYIMERSPDPKRPDLPSLLLEAGMDHYNRLEWMTKANKRYTGDNLVTKPADFDDGARYVDANPYLREESIIRMLGMRRPIIIDGVSFSDESRAALLKSHLLDYARMSSKRSKAIEKGQAKAKKRGAYHRQETHRAR